MKKPIEGVHYKLTGTGFNVRWEGLGEYQWHASAQSFSSDERAKAHAQDCFPRLQTKTEKAAEAESRGYDLNKNGCLVRRSP